MVNDFPPSVTNDSATEAPLRSPDPIHSTRTPPWGMVTILEEGARYRINRIVVKPGHHMSTQMHYHRSEHWVVVSGTAKVTCNGEERFLRQKESTYVPMNTPHRVENPGVIDLVLIEVQNGEYLGDDDIIRFADDGNLPNSQR